MSLEKDMSYTPKELRERISETDMLKRLGTDRRWKESNEYNLEEIIPDIGYSSETLYVRVSHPSLDETYVLRYLSEQNIFVCVRKH